MPMFDVKASAAGALNWLVRRQLGPFHRRRAEIAQTQWLDRSALGVYQLDHLRQLLQHAYGSVPYYRESFDRCGFHPDQCRDLSALQRLPLLTKRDAVRSGHRLVSSAFPRSLTRSAYTSGTTGTPLKLRRDLWSIGNEHAFVRRQLDWAGVKLGELCAILTGRVIFPPDKQEGRLYRYDPVMKELLLSTYHLGEHVISQYASAMIAHRVTALLAYPSAALKLARGCLAKGIKVPLRAVLTSSETLLPDARETIAAAFGCSVFDYYGLAERACYIHTCERGSYHILSDYGITELLPVESSPNTYRIVATGFWSHAMPFIRYDLDDIVEVHDTPCPCGRQFPTVHRILGRAGDHISTPTGRELGSAVLSHLFYGVANILESQLVQDAPDHISILYVPTEHFDEHDLADLRQLVKKHLPSELRVDLARVSEIRTTKAGKFVHIKNLVRDRSCST